MCFHREHCTFQALQTVKDLEDKLLSLEQQDLGEMREKNGGKEIRIWMDGAFDMMHYGESIQFAYYCTWSSLGR